MTTVFVQPPAVDPALYAVRGVQYPHWVGNQGYAIVKSAETVTTTWRVFYVENGIIRSLPGYEYTLTRARARADAAGDLTEGK